MSDLTSFFSQQAFDTHSVEAQTDFDIIPAGKYPVIVEKAEVKATKKQNGHGIAISMKVLDGPHKGKSLQDWINIDHRDSPQCVEIGQRCLAALGQAIGLTAVSDTTQLLNQAVIAHIRVKDNQNNVRTYSSVQQYSPPAQASDRASGSPPPLTPIQPQGLAPAPVAPGLPHRAQANETAPPPWAAR